jgi:hypothetical protein
MPGALIALQQTQLGLGILVAIALAAALLIPYLVKEIRRGKVELGPQVKETPYGIKFGADTPIGAGDNHPGRPGNPAPGQPDAQADPYSEEAQRNAPPVKS